MSDNDTLAAILYGESPAPALAPAAPAGEPKEASQALYGGAEPGQGNAGLDPVYAVVQREIITAGVERLGVEETEAQQSAQAWGEVFRDADIGTAEASGLVQVGIAALANGVDDAALEQWGRDARALIKTEFGATHELALQDAQAYVAQHPKLASYLDASGLGNHPKIVLAAARKGRALRLSGKLK
jgi:hypothetical protein